MLFFKKIKNFYRLKWLQWFTGVAVLLLLNLWIADQVFPLPTLPSYSPLVMAKDSTILHAALSPDDKWRMQTELHEITPDLRRVILHKEDRYFYYHFGINPFSIAKAFISNTIHGRTLSGASTITMQVARLLQPKSRTYSHKLLEMLRAMQLEWHYSKDEILQLYLNLVSYGGNVEGVKAASLLYFGQKPDQLSLAQVVTLSIIPNRPTSLRLGRNNQLLIAERNKWLQKLKGANLFDSSTIADAIDEPLKPQRVPAPTQAPHLARWLQQRFPNQALIYTSIRAQIQQKTQQLAYNYVQRLHFRNIHNAAVLVVNNQTHQIEAYIGSSDYADEANGGQVNGVRAVRSPGSTLKPLIYGLAFDKGLITPKTCLNDVPTNFDGYSPDNFDHKFNGRVTVETALAYSLNVPAVKTLEILGVPALTTSLKQAGFAQIAADQYKLGLSAALGGCGVTLEELCGLYSTFANGGNCYALSVVPEEKATLRARLISGEAAFMLTEILSQISRPDLPHNFASSAHIPKVAWKTGTSYGRRDAWSIGYNHRYTVGVWVGNFSGEGVPELTGADIATPLMFEVFNSIDYNSTNNWFAKPNGLKDRLVCAQTGLLPNYFCKELITDYYLPLVSSGQRCQHLREVLVSEDESCSYCSACVPESGYKRKMYPYFSPELLAFYKETRSHRAEEIPTHYARCRRILGNNEPPRIVSPANLHEYFWEKGEETKLMLACQAAADVQTVYWYINDHFLAEAQSTEHLFFEPERGNIKISCTDDKGRTSHIEILVK